MAHIKALATIGAVGLLAGGLLGSPAAGSVERSGAARVWAQPPVAQGLSASASGYKLRSVHVVRRVRTPRAYDFPVDVTYPQMSGGKAKWRARFNRAVVAGVKRVWRSQSASVDSYDGQCRDMAAMHGGWSGGFVNNHYASILLDWDSGSCGGVSWNSQFVSTTMSIRTGKLHSLPYMMAKLGGRASWDTAGALVRAQQTEMDCASGWGSVTPYKPAGWRVDSEALHLAFSRYQIGYGACGSPTYRLSWADYRSELVNHQD